MPEVAASTERVIGAGYRRHRPEETLLYQVEVITLKLDEQYWPTNELRRTSDGWRREAVPKTSNQI